MYKRYVDDTLWLLPENSDIPSLLTFLNSIHPNLKFTCETEKSQTIPFLGIQINRETNSNQVSTYTTSLYHKPTSTPLLMNFHSFVPLSYRVSVIQASVNRILNLCSCWQFVHVEIQYLRTILLRNFFPSWVIDKVVKALLNKFFKPQPKYGPMKERVYIGLPFLGSQTDLIRRKIKLVFNTFIPHKEVIVYFKSGLRIKNFFKIKDVTPTVLRSRVIYKFTCANCQAGYIGQTSRHLCHRIAEHRGTSHLTGKIMKNKVHSNIRDHVNACPSSNITADNFRVLASASSEQELLIKERLLIGRLRPSLNGNVGSAELLFH